MYDWFIELFTDPTAKRLLVAFALGAVVGAERQWRKDIGGLRINVLVSLGAAAFIDLMTAVGQQSAMNAGIGSIVTGVGFIGAGLIMKEGMNVRGLNTAATVWCSAAMGATAGASEFTAAVLICLFITGANLILRPVVEMLNRQPEPANMEPALFTVYVSAAADAAQRLRAELGRLATASGLSLRAVSTKAPNDDGMVQLGAELESPNGHFEPVQVLVDGLSAQAPHCAVRWQTGSMSTGNAIL